MRIGNRHFNVLSMREWIRAVDIPGIATDPEVPVTMDAPMVQPPRSPATAFPSR